MNKITIIGDFMLDKYVFGDVTRISPEAPVPIVLKKSTEYRVGGAGNVSQNISSINGNTINIGILGIDTAAEDIIRQLSESNNKGLIKAPNRPTTLKTRVIAGNQQLLRIDSEITTKLDEENSYRLIEAYKQVLPETSLLVISDYGKGVIHETLVKSIIEASNQNNIKVIVDPKKPNYNFYQGAYLLTPNTKEASEMLEKKLEIKDFENAGYQIAEKYGVENVIITRGSEGMSIYEKGQAVKHIRPTARQVFDVTGAGDTVIATLAVALQKGLPIYEAAQIANYAAGIVVEKIGTTPIEHEELERALKKQNNDLHKTFFKK